MVLGTLETALGRRHALHARVELDRHAQGAAECLECGFRLVVRVVALEIVDVQRDQRVIGEALEEFMHQIDVELADTRAHKVDFQRQSRTAREVDHHARQRFVERHIGVAVTAYAILGAERLDEGLAERDADVLDGVMRVDVQIAPGFDFEVERAMARDLIEHVIRPVIPAQFANDDYQVLVNPTGRFVIGGPVGDAGLTGRKIIVDTYGGMARHGGGAFSGKDPSKVDRSAAYAARWVAKNVVAAGAADRCEVQVAYAIGVAHPVSIMVETFGTNNVDEEKIAAAVREVFDLRPAAIARDLDLRKPRYKQTAAYGHFGRTGDAFTWERTDRVDALKSELGL